MVKVILQLYPMIPAADEVERAALRPIGRNRERYQEALAGWSDIVRAADEMGVWGVSTIEHHFHSEGYEVGPNPGVLNAYWAAITKQARVGALGYVMSAQDPIRVAEETAILDHLTQGRTFVGFARGYQARWSNVLGQHVGSRATLSPTGVTDTTKEAYGSEQRAKNIEDDRINREVFEESIDIVLRAWTQDSIEHNSNRWQIPYPHSGLTWPMRATETLGAPGEMGPDGLVKRISVVPSPFSRPHPPVFVASNASEDTISYCARMGFIPSYFSAIGRASRWGSLYRDIATQHGRDLPLGKNQALVRWMQTGTTMEEARAAVAQYDVEIYRNLYAGLTPMPLDPADGVGSVLNSGLWSVGDHEQVREQFVSQWKELPAEYVILIFHYAQQPKHSVLQNLEAFMEKVKPALDAMTNYD